MSLRWSRAAWVGALCLVLAALLAIAGAQPGWVVAPLMVFLSCIAIAPAFSRLGFFLDVLSRGDRSRPEVALTFDDGPDPKTMPALLSLLAEFDAPATFFMVGTKVRANPEAVRQAIECGHEIGNHSMSHDTLLMLRPVARLRLEITQCQDELRALGVEPVAFRPPVGITNSRLPAVLDDLGLACVTFNNRPLDFGNQRIEKLAERVLRKVSNGDVILLHDVWPFETPIEPWLIEVRAILEGIRSRGLKVAPLSRVLNRTVMRKVTPAAAPVPPGSAAPVPSRFVSVVNVIISVTQGFAVIAYPLTTYLGVESLGVRLAALLMLGLHAPAVLRTIVKQGRKALGLAGMGLAVVTLCVLSAVLEDTRFMIAYPSLVNAAFLSQFAWSLVKGPPMVERFARLQTTELGPAELLYCRSVTKVWCAFFALNGSIITLLAYAAPASWWAAYASGLSYLLAGALFAGEFTVRRVRFGKFTNSLPDRMLKLLLPQAIVDRGSRHQVVSKEEANS